MPLQKTDRKSITVAIKLSGDSFPSPEEFDLRIKFEDEINDRGIGQYTKGGSGGGWMDIFFEVENERLVQPALRALHELFQEFDVSKEDTKVTVSDVEEQVCDDLPEYQPGDCLAYRFEDEEYGAALVLDSKTAFQDAPLTLLGFLDCKQADMPDIQIFRNRD